MFVHSVDAMDYLWALPFALGTIELLLRGSRCWPECVWGWRPDAGSRPSSFLKLAAAHTSRLVQQEAVEALGAANPKGLSPP